LNRIQNNIEINQYPMKKDMMRSSVTSPLLSIFFAIMTVASSHVVAQTSETITPSTAENTPQRESAASSVPTRLSKEIDAHARLMQDLEELCDDIGARLTGSQKLRTAQAWAMAKLTAYGATNVHEEAYDLGRPWTRGIARARLVNANGMSLQIAQKAWTSASKGMIKGEVALLNVKTLAELKAAARSLTGKVVLVESWPKASAEQARNMPLYLEELARTLTAAKFSLLLFISEKDGALLETWGGPSTFVRKNEAIITKEHANLLKRLISRGITPQVEAELSGGFGPKPTKAYNVIADFVGTEAPEEMLIVGAHLDSWDIAPGATDNGTGVVVAMEVLRAMHALSLKPKRTLRVILFSGEEQGLLGSKAYLAAHQSSLDKIQAVLVQDAGAGKILGFPDMKVDAWYAALTPIVNAAKDVAELELIYGGGGGSDHQAFFEQGVPAFAPKQELLDYRSHTQHAQIDTIDHVVKENVVQSAKVMAIASWVLLNAEKIPHEKKTEQH
jgi:carboxypeptidase Q